MGVCLDQVVDLSDHVAFQASDDVAFGLALGGAVDRGIELSAPTLVDAVLPAGHP